MTEKRFTFDKYSNLYDNEVNTSYGIANSKEAEILCDMLNALHEENNQLKERNEFLKKQLDRVCIDNEEMGDKLKKIGRII